MSGDSEDTPGVVGAPLVADGLVILWAPDGLHGIDIRDGKTVWTNTTLNPTAIERLVDVEPPPTVALPPTPIAPPAADDNGTVYVGESDSLAAIDTADGSIRWRYTGIENVGPPTVAGDAVFVTSNAGLVAVGGDGRERWRWEATLDPQLLAVADETVVFTGVEVGDEEQTCAFDTATGQRRWARDFGFDDELYPVASDGVFYATGGAGLTAHNLNSSEKLWLFDRRNQGFKPPVVTDDSLYLSERHVEPNGSVFALDRTGGKPSPRWCSILDSVRGWITGATSNRVFAYSEANKRLIAFRPSFGVVPWAYEGAGQLRPPAIVDGALVIADSEGRLALLGEGSE